MQSRVRFKVLQRERFEQGRLADAGLADEVHMRQPVGLLDAEADKVVSMIDHSEIGNAAIAEILHFAIIADERRTVQRGVLAARARNTAAPQPEP